jgi:hypothetical protein
MTAFLRGLRRQRTTEIDAFRKELEDNYDDVAYLEDLAERVAIYNKEYPVREGYVLLDEIDERILELDNAS